MLVEEPRSQFGTIEDDYVILSIPTGAQRPAEGGTEGSGGQGKGDSVGWASGSAAQEELESHTLPGAAQVRLASLFCLICRLGRCSCSVLHGDQALHRCAQSCMICGCKSHPLRLWHPRRTVACTICQLWTPPVLLQTLCMLHKAGTCSTKHHQASSMFVASIEACSIAGTGVLALPGEGAFLQRCGSCLPEALRDAEALFAVALCITEVAGVP